MNPFKALLILLITLSVMSFAQASVPFGNARKGTGGKFDMYGCMQSNDYYVVNFAAYQLDPTQAKDDKTLPTAECIDLPLAGKTQITLDLLDRDVRRKQVALKILTSDGKILVDTPMAIAKQGVISTTVNFPSAGNYEVVLSVNDTDMNMPPDVSALHIPLTVALVVTQPVGQNIPWIFLVLLIVAIVTAAYFAPRILKPQPIA